MVIVWPTRAGTVDIDVRVSHMRCGVSTCFHCQPSMHASTIPMSFGPSFVVKQAELHVLQCSPDSSHTALGTTAEMGLPASESRHAHLLPALLANSVGRGRG